MYVIAYSGRAVGPFETADVAAEWAEENLVKPGINQSTWLIQRLTTPDEAQIVEQKFQKQMQTVQSVPPHTHDDIPTSTGP